MSTSTCDINATAARAAGELDALNRQRLDLYATRPADDAAWATRSAVLALNHAREAGWWRVLARATREEPTLARVFGHAVVIAECHARDRARFWRESAADWTARAQGRPTSDAAGALSNWAELGVTA